MTITLDPSTTSAPASAPSVDVDELVRAHLPLVGHFVREVLNRVPAHVSRDELVSAGMYALALSAKNFDSSLGVPFARFAAIRIRGALTDELRTMDWASRAVRGKARELEAVRADLTQTLGRAPLREELGQSMGVSTSELAGIEADVHRAAVLSLHALSPEEGAEILPYRGDGPEAMLLKREQLGYLRDAVAELPERMRTVVQQYFFEQRKMADIAEDLGVTESRISQLRSEALVLLRAGMNAADGTPAADPTPARGRNAVKQAYCVSVATRSSLAGRLAATTLLCETRPSVDEAALQVAN